MQTSRRTTVIVVGGALAVASVGYGLGTQADDGTAIAGGDQSSDSRENRSGGPPRLRASEASRRGSRTSPTRSGVDADKLAQALP